MSVHKTVKWSAFVASVVTLSWFFAGWRQVNESGQLTDWAVLFGGTLSTALLLFVQGYWIYCEEKERGRLTKRVVVYEKIKAHLDSRAEAKARAVASREAASNIQDRGVKE